MKTIKDAYIYFNGSNKIPEDDDACLYYDDDYGYLWFNHRIISRHQYICKAKQLRDYKGNNTMIKFDLERALAGDKVVTRSGREVTQIHSFTLGDKVAVCGVRGASVGTWNSLGEYHSGSTSDSDLLMAPEKLSGFVNVYKNGICGNVSKTKALADLYAKTKQRIACIDLSQFEEGHGL